VRQLHESMLKAIPKRGFRFIEVLSPCPVGFGKSNEIGEGLDEMWMYRRNCLIEPDVDLSRAGIDMKHDSEIAVGEFVDIERPVYRPAGAEA